MTGWSRKCCAYASVMSNGSPPPTSHRSPSTTPLSGGALLVTDVVRTALGPSVDNAASAVQSFWTEAGINGVVGFELNTTRPSTATVRHDAPGVRLDEIVQVRGESPVGDRRGDQLRNPAGGQHRRDGGANAGGRQRAAGARSRLHGNRGRRDRRDRECGDEHRPARQTQRQPDRRCRWSAYCQRCPRAVTARLADP